MKLATFNLRGRTSFGAITDEGVIDLRSRVSPRCKSVLDLLREDALDEARAAARGVRPDFPSTEVEWLPPVLGPEKILCAGINYAGRPADFRDIAKVAERPKYPSLFFRTPGSIIGHEQPLIRPSVSVQFDYEGEIVLVIGREGRHVAREHALDHVAGLTLCNEGSVRDWLRHGTFNVTQGKNFDASGSMGPWLVTLDDVDLSKPLHLTTKVNGEIRQDDTTANLIFPFADLIAYITTFTTLKPGDLIITGTPTGVGARFDPPRWLVPGDVVEIEVAEIGVLRNDVIDERLD
jgi:2-keto-4-pentenoate hydratase/2-oxohepta-3-ene-1,7-dioic acid hydratase in catechol pathway